MTKNIRRIPRAPDATALPKWLFRACRRCGGDMYYEVSVTQGHWFREYSCLLCARSVPLKKALLEIERYALKGDPLRL